MGGCHRTPESGCFVTPAQKLERLEAVLARVLLRATSQTPPLTRAAAPEPAAPAGDVVTTPSAPAPAVDAEFEWPTRPPPPPEAAIAEEAHLVEPPIDTSLDSRERLVAAAEASPPAADLGPAVDAHIEPQTSADAPAVDVTPSDHPVLEQQSPSELDSERPQDADVEIEQPPASSRRPLGPEPEEQIARIAFGSDTEEPPRHTPPPESGRLPSPDESDLRAEIDSPGTLDPFEAKTDERPLAARPANPRSPGSRLVVVETRAVLPTDGDVAKVANDASVKEPLSFAELLRASLAL